MNFGQAIELLKSGNKVARQGWNGKGQFLLFVHWTYLGEEGRKQMVDAGAKRFPPFIAIKTNYDAVVPWVPSQSDQLAEDWEVVV